MTVKPPFAWAWFGVAVISILSFALVSLQTSSPGREPEWDDRTLSTWLVELNDLHANQVETAANALRGIGTNAVPFLLTRLAAADFPRVGVFEKLCVFLHVKHRRTPASYQHSEAVRAFRILGTNAAVALPDLSRLLRSRVAAADKDSSIAIAQAMAAVGEQAKSPLVAELENASPNVRLAALTALVVDYDEDAKDAMPSIMARVKDSSAEIRGLALYFVSQFCDDIETKRRVLSDALQDTDAEVRRFAAKELAKMTPSPTDK